MFQLFANSIESIYRPRPCTIQISIATHDLHDLPTSGCEDKVKKPQSKTHVARLIAVFRLSRGKLEENQSNMQV